VIPPAARSTTPTIVDDADDFFDDTIAPATSKPQIFDRDRSSDRDRSASNKDRSRSTDGNRHSEGRRGQSNRNSETSKVAPEPEFEFESVDDDDNFSDISTDVEAVLIDEPMVDDSSVVQNFATLGCLSPEILKCLTASKYLDPTPIQSALIPKACLGKDCIGQARTGTGKTAAFIIPVLEHLTRTHSEGRKTPVALVLSPTRELAEQVANEARKIIGDHLPYKVISAVGGRSLHQQKIQLKEGAAFVVGTPGRVIDLLRQGVLNLSKLEYVVLDEADRMLDIGFMPDIKRILRQCPNERQTLLLSATLPPAIEALAGQFMREPIRMDLSGDKITVDQIEQFYCSVDPDRKFRMLVHLLSTEKPQQVIVFCRTKVRAHELYTKFSVRISSVEAIHGDLQQSKRDQAMKKLRDGKVRLLIATDIVGRGIDVSGVSHIINFDIPEDCDDYVHRVGRTGRLSSNSRGRAITFVSKEEGIQLTRIEKRINRMLEEYPNPGFELVKNSRRR
jgi:ATP-dependent RNA helicase DeaD